MAISPILKSLFLLILLIGNTWGQVDFQKILNSSQRGLNFSGNMLIQRGETILLKHSAGMAIREWDMAHDWDSRFMIASLTKQFTAYLVLSLVEEGKLSLDERVSELISLPKNAQTKAESWSKITVKDLLTHTSGLIRDVPRTEWMSPSEYNLISTVIDLSLLGKDVFFQAPGNFHYSNFGYLLLAEIIEKKGLSFYERFLQKKILWPLKMRNTGEYHRMKVIKKMSHGYYYDEGRKIKKRCCRDAMTFTGSHNLYSTVEDLKIWMNELHKPSGILNEKILTLMKTPQVETSFGHYGYGLFIEEIQGKKTLWHNGHEWGFSSLLSFVPSEDLMIIYLSNSHGMEVFDLVSPTQDLQNKVIETLSQKEVGH
jgi:CubicO group peptidase (beta-lactamase class C family)